MEWQFRYYPDDVFPTIITRFDQLASDKKLLIHEIVEEELKAVGGAKLEAWAKERKSWFIKTDENLLLETKSIQDNFPGLLDPKSEYEEADAYVIALAKINNGTVVTQETSASEKRKPKRTHFIPDVCRELGIDCISLLGLMRRESWSF